MEELWIARDKDHSLWLYLGKPVKDTVAFTAHVNSQLLSKLPPLLFEEITWENSPKKVEVKLTEN